MINLLDMHVVLPIYIIKPFSGVWVLEIIQIRIKGSHKARIDHSLHDL
jgi:hypothetical protein